MYFVVQVLDISERKAAEEELERYTEALHELALVDGLTELPGLRALEVELDRLLGQDPTGAGEVALVLFDVDGLSAANQLKGRAWGDQALREVAAALRDGTREGDFAARIGGDEFALLLPGRGEEEAREIAIRVRDSVASGKSKLGVSHGVAVAPHRRPHPRAAAAARRHGPLRAAGPPPSPAPVSRSAAPAGDPVELDPVRDRAGRADPLLRS